MKKFVVIGASALALGACSGISSVDGPSGMHHSQDNKGQYAFPDKRPATGRKVVIFDPRLTAWAAYDANGHRVKTGRASGGKGYCADVGRSCRTPSGTYRVYSKKGADCVSSKFPLETNGGAPMPYCMHFYKGFALHGSYNVPDYNASHGCVRVLPSAARWLNQNFVDVGTTLIVKPY